MTLTAEQRNEVVSILSLMECPADFYIFGSRAAGTNRPYSDLDILIKADQAVPFEQIVLIEEAFSESDLPFLVDVVDWNRISKEFRERIAPEMVRFSVEKSCG